MKKFLKFFLSSVVAVVMCTLVAGSLGLVPESGLLSDLMNLILPSSGVIMGFAATVAGVAGPGTIEEGGAELGNNPEEKEYIDDDLNDIITKVRPSDSPLDTLTRNIKNTRTVESYECGGWEMGIRDSMDQLAGDLSESASEATITIGKKGMWLKGDTILVDGVEGKNGGPLGLYVVAKGTGDTLIVKALNATDDKVPVLTTGTNLIRLSTAHAEKSAQTTPFNMAPTTRRNYCQIHMAQVEETVLHSLQKKKVAMDFSTYKEQAIYDMKYAMERTNLFGVKGITTNEDNEAIYLSEGVWHQCPNEFEYTKGKPMDNASYVAMTRAIFDKNNGSESRFFFVGSGLLESMSYVEGYAKQLAASKVEVVHGVKVRRIVTDFGELLIKPMSSLFEGSMADNGLVLDMNYLIKYVREPLHTTELDLDKTGQRRVKAVRLLEDYALFLENLPTHHKIIGRE